MRGRVDSHGDGANKGRVWCALTVVAVVVLEEGSSGDAELKVPVEEYGDGSTNENEVDDGLWEKY